MIRLAATGVSMKRMGISTWLMMKVHDSAPKVSYNGTKVSAREVAAKETTAQFGLEPA